MPIISALGAMSSRGFGEFNQQGPFNYIEDVFSTYLYTGNGSTQTITNGIDLSTKGGMVWIKRRNVANSHRLFDTLRNWGNYLSSDQTTAQTFDSQGLTSFDANGFSLGTSIETNGNNGIFASWTFRKQPKFFDIVTYIGDGSVSRTVNHNLGSVPGMIIIKSYTSGAAVADWQVYHRSLASQHCLFLNKTDASFSDYDNWGAGGSFTNTSFTPGQRINTNGVSYVAYLFAHDTTADGVIQCGSYTGNGSTTGPEINLGWEPQFVIIKNASTTGYWSMFDNMRGIATNGDDAWMKPNTADQEYQVSGIGLTATGFKLETSDGPLNGSGNTLIYLAIRRGPMRVPTDATKVFVPTVYTGTNVDNRLVNTTIAPDTVWIRQRNSTTVGGMVVGDRLRGQPYLLTGSNQAEVNDADSFDQQLVSAVEYGTAFSSMNGVWVGNDATSQLNASTTASNQIIEAFKRAPGFFDIVYYNFNSYGASPTSVNHNLNVVPELIISKQVNGSDNWYVYHASLGANKRLSLNTNSAVTTGGSDYIDNLTKTTFRAMWYQNISGNSITYLFATCPGVSKVGSYTGTGTTLQINCGFTAGARFVLIKRTDTTGDWYVYDSARGIVASDDPYILTNSTAAEVTNTDYVDTYSAGFELSSTAPAGLNANGGTYIFLAIA